MEQEQKAAQWLRPQDVRRFRTSDPKQMKGMYLAEGVQRKWTEDFVDEDTQELVSIERSEPIMSSGLLLDGERISKILFHIQSGDIEDVLVTDSNCNAERYIMPSMAAWEIQVSSGAVRYNYLVRAQSAEKAIQVATDYAIMYLGLRGWYNVRKANVVSYHIVEDDDKCIPQEEPSNEDKEKENEYDYYKVSVQLRTYDLEDDVEKESHEFIIKAHDVGQAKNRISEYAREYWKTLLKDNPSNNFAVLKASPYATDGIVPIGYCELYFEKQEY